MIAERPESLREGIRTDDNHARSKPKTSEGVRVDRLDILFRPPVAYSLLAMAALGYSLVALMLALADARAMPEPYLRIDAEEYFWWGAVFYPLVILTAWLLASNVVFLLALTARPRPQFTEVLTAMAAAVGVGTFGTLLPDLVTSPLRALGVIDEHAWEQSISEQTGWFIFTWCTLILYLLLFLVAFPIAVRRSTDIGGWRAACIGVAAFIVFQGFEYLFIR
jgi:hypothetical protein